MPGSPSTAPPARVPATRVLRSPLALWAAFALVHGILITEVYRAPNLPLGDVTLVYENWMAQAFSGAGTVGLDRPWVYPVLALVPMALAGAAGLGHYLVGWIVLVVVLDAVAFAYLIGGFRAPARRHRAAWWWLAFLLALGPIAIGRIDAVTVPIAIVAVLFVAGRPGLAGVLLTAAMWMKVWPVALLGALVIATRARMRIVIAAAVTSALVIAISLVLGSGWNVFSFITEQTGRGVQIESPVATPWLWAAATGAPSTWVYFDREIVTYQVTGPGTSLVAGLMTPLLILVAGVVAVVGIRAAVRGAPVAALLPPLALAFTLVLLVVNKVGSPQFTSWLSAAVVLGILWRGGRFRVPAVAALVLAALTHVIYPYLYDAVVLGESIGLVLLGLRNLLEVVLLVWAVVAVWRSVPARHADPLGVGRSARSAASRRD